MTERERFLQTLLFGRPDRVVLQPGWPRESTLAAWRAQGLPEQADWQERLYGAVGIQWLSPGERVPLGVSFEMIPTFDEKVLEHRDGHYVVQDWMGAITEISDRYDYTYLHTRSDFVTRKWHSFPVANPTDWEQKIRWRYDAHDSRRFPEDFDERCKALRDRQYPLQVHVNGPFWQLREWCGFEGLCLLMAEQPDFVEEMARFWADHVLEVLEPILDRVPPDNVYISEDMAYKEHSMISPAMTRRFLVPAYRKWIAAIKDAGCPLVSMDSDGYVGELIPIWIEVGINVCSPLEVAAGNDIVAYRRQFGSRMAYLGGIDKRALAAGGEQLRAEVARVVPPLLEGGGYIPSCDHGVPPDISWASFIEYTRMLAQLTGWL